ncbi:hypothetical protein FAI41_04695 [Acetobacteraceae bacterium]|nr:hypothetical protein FAI41_04695 [Acetobacteraceae bacterium]
MYKKTVLVSVLFFPLLLVTSVRADSPYYAPGHIQGEGGSVEGAIDSGGHVSAVGGKITETIDSAGHISAAGGEITETIDPAGRVSAAGRGIIGSIDSAGHVSTAGGGIIGSIDSAGRVSAAGGGVIGSVPPGNPVLAFQMIQRYNRQKQQQARYNQQYYQQRNAVIAAQNAAIVEQNCRTTYRLSEAPYEEVIASVVFKSDCSQFRNQIVEDYLEHAGELHRKDCDIKMLSCHEGDSISCRPYWTYCSDYDRERRQDKHWKGAKLPSLSTKPHQVAQSGDLSCNEEGRLFLFDQNIRVLGGVKVTSGGLLWRRKKQMSNSPRYEIGQIDKAGHITPNKHIKSKDFSMLKKTVIAGRITEGGDVIRCGVSFPPARLGFYDASGTLLPLSGKYPKDVHFLLLDQLDATAPIFIAGVEGEF